jgi:hypothetical protein
LGSKIHMLLLRARSTAVRAVRPWQRARLALQLSTDAAAPAVADKAVNKKLWNEHLAELFTRQASFTFPASARPAIFEKVRHIKPRSSHDVASPKTAGAHCCSRLISANLLCFASLFLTCRGCQSRGGVTYPFHKSIAPWVALCDITGEVALIRTCLTECVSRMDRYVDAYHAMRYLLRTQVSFKSAIRSRAQTGSLSARYGE